jgi:hypothetical protein
MHKSLLSFTILASAAALAGFTLPAIAGSVTSSTAGQPAAETIDLDKVPVKPIAGPQSISGVAVDDDAGDESADDGSGYRTTHRLDSHSTFGFEDDDESDMDD